MGIPTYAFNILLFSSREAEIDRRIQELFEFILKLFPQAYSVVTDPRNRLFVDIKNNLELFS